MSATIPQVNENVTTSRGWRPAIATRLLPRSNFARNVATVASASAVAQGLLVLASPLVTRLYTPEDFGIFTVFTSLLSIITVPACGRFEQAIVLPKEDPEAIGVLGVALSALLLTIGVICAYLCFFSGATLAWTNTDGLHQLLWLLPPTLLGSGTCQAMSYWTIRTKQFGCLGKSRLVQSTSQILTQLMLGMTVSGPAGLVLGTFVGRIGGAYTLLRSGLPSLTMPDSATLARLAARYRRFPLFSAPAALLSTLAQSLPSLFVISIFGPMAAGLFALIQSLLSVPVNIVSAAVGQVYLSESARIGRNRAGQQSLFWSVLRKMLLIGSPLVLGAAINLERPIAFVFGAQWAESAAYIPPLVLFCFSGLVVTPLGSILDVVERQDLHLFREILRVAIVSIAGSLAACNGTTPLTTVEILCAAGIASHISYACISWWAIRAISDPGSE
jgi:O-antigen/teichoic acid export membrane protein